MIELRWIKKGFKHEPEMILQYRNGTSIETYPEARTTRIEYIWTDWKDVPVVEEE